jgi:hypothetical protein
MMDEKTINEKLKFYIGKGFEVHIVKKNKEWLNCFVISEETDGVYVVKERKFGLIHVFAGEIYTVEECRRETNADTKST